jgi:hypothetical protein
LRAQVVATNPKEINDPILASVAVAYATLEAQKTQIKVTQELNASSKRLELLTNNLLIITGFVLTVSALSIFAALWESNLLLSPIGIEIVVFLFGFLIFNLFLVLRKQKPIRS